MSHLRALPRTLRYARHWLGLGRRVREDEAELERGGPDPRTVRLVRLAPPGSGPGDQRRTAWILLHGITRPGIDHATFRRFARALAASGSVVYLPEVPEWVDLQLAPGETTHTVEATLDRVARDPVADPSRVGLMGFSFGAPQALITSGAPGVAGRLASVAAFGGYCDLEAVLRFHLTGEFESRGRTLRHRPDPYGRWIVVANYLTGIEGHEGAGDVAAALRELAAVAGDAQVPAWDARFDDDVARLRRTVSPERRSLFDRFALPPAAATGPDDDEVSRWIEGLAGAARKAEPLVEPLPHIDGLPPSVHLLHGRDDVLIPFPETERLAAGLRAGSALRAGESDLHVEVTGLFAHSGESGGPGGMAALGEGLRFARALGRVLGSP